MEEEKIGKHHKKEKVKQHAAFLGARKSKRPPVNVLEMKERDRR